MSADAVGVKVNKEANRLNATAKGSAIRILDLMGFFIVSPFVWGAEKVRQYSGQRSLDSPILVVLSMTYL